MHSLVATIRVYACLRASTTRSIMPKRECLCMCVCIVCMHICAWCVHMDVCFGVCGCVYLEVASPRIIAVMPVGARHGVGTDENGLAAHAHAHAHALHAALRLQLVERDCERRLSASYVPHMYATFLSFSYCLTHTQREEHLQLGHLAPQLYSEALNSKICRPFSHVGTLKTRAFWFSAFARVFRCLVSTAKCFQNCLQVPTKFVQA